MVVAVVVVVVGGVVDLLTVYFGLCFARGRRTLLMFYSQTLAMSIRHPDNYKMI